MSGNSTTTVSLSGRTSITIGTPGARGPSYPEQLFVAGAIDAPTLDAAKAYLAAESLDAAASANTAAENANDKAALAQQKADAAQGVVDAGASILEAADATEINRSATEQLFTNAQAFLPTLLAAETGYSWGLFDRFQRAALLITKGGATCITSFVPGTVREAAIGDLAVTSIKVAAGAINREKLSDDLRIVIPSSSDIANTGYAYYLVDAANRLGFGMRQSGVFYAPRFETDAGQITKKMLESEIATYLAQPMATETGYFWSVLDQFGRVGLGLTADGSLVCKLKSIAGAVVSTTNLQQPLSRQILPTPTDVVEVSADTWRAHLADVSVRTNADGTLWAPFPKASAAGLHGTNRAGVSIDIRRSHRLPIVGKRYAGTFDPGSIPSTILKGQFSSGTPAAAAAAIAGYTPVLGDYFQYILKTTLIVGSDTYAIGDMAVYNGATWVRQAAPAPFNGGYDYTTQVTTRLPGDWYVLTGAGTYDGVPYDVGDRIIYLGFKSNSIYGQARFITADVVPNGRGDLLYRGEFTPTSGLPASPSDGEVYQASATGTASGFMIAAGDYIIRREGRWAQHISDTITTVAQASPVSLSPTSESTGYEVRRTDKSSSIVRIALQARRQTSPRRNQDSLALFSDSLFAVNIVGQRVLDKLGRTGIVNASPSGLSHNVLSEMEWAIINGDPYAGWVHVFWHGQNNGPDGGVNDAQIRESTYKMAELIGSRDRRYMFLSVLGTRAYTWTGSRIALNQFEYSFNGTGSAWLNLERWYEASFHGQWFNTRQALLTAAAMSTLPDPHFPGMTEAQVAANYGIPPFSYFRGIDAAGAILPVPQASLHFVGYLSTAGLPTGGATNDYYVRIAGGTVGNLVINVNGTWQEPSLDTVHMSPAGAEALATAIANRILTNNW